MIIEPEYSVLDCDNFYRFDFMEDVSFQKKMVKGKKKVTFTSTLLGFFNFILYQFCFLFNEKIKLRRPLQFLCGEAQKLIGQLGLGAMWSFTEN